jgi:nitrous oxidase accessory protein NosD
MGDRKAYISHLDYPSTVFTLKKGVNGLGLIFAVLFVTLAFVSIGCVSAATTYVNPGESIQAAVNAAQEGDTIIVRDDTYTENVNVNKQLTIRSGSGPGNCLVHAANADDHVFEITANYVTISGFTIRSTATGYYQVAGLYLFGAEHCEISVMS